MIFVSFYNIVKYMFFYMIFIIFFLFIFYITQHMLLNT